MEDPNQEKKSRFDLQPHYIEWGLTALGVIVACVLVVFVLFRMTMIWGIIKKFFSILSPFIYGFVMAYLLMPVFNMLYRNLQPPMSRKFKNGTRLAKGLCSALTLTFGLAVVGVLLWMVLPQVISSIVGLVESNLLTNSIQNVTGWIEDTLQNNPQFEAAAQRVYAEAVAALTAWVKTDMLPQLTNLMSGLLGTLTFFKNVFIGIIIAIYVLNSKQLFAAQAKKLLYGCLSTRRANIVLDNARFTHRVFGGFINGKLLDSLIIGILCFVGMTALRMPYAMLISVVVGVTNIIPFFGPFIGAIPSGLLILLIDPLKALYFVLFILALQQFDGNILGPKILGDSTGLSSFWVMFAILLAGGLFGFVGMVVGVPLFAVLYSILSGLVCHSLRRRGMPEETQAYYELDHVDERTHDILYNEAPARPAAGSADRPE
mgnify:FL=1